jgi:hypothetical protein
VGGLLGGIAVAAGAAGKGGKSDYNKAVQAWEKLKTSDFDFRALDPPELQVLGEMMPEVYTAVVPEEFQQIEESPVRQEQLHSLARLREIADEGEPALDRIQRMEMEDAIAGAHGRATESTLRDVARRGALGSGDELRARIAAGAQAGQMASDYGRGTVADAALRRLAATRDLGQMAGDVRGQDLQRAGRNVDIANRFNELFSAMKTDEARYGAGARQAAQDYNLGRRAQVSDVNAANRYTAALENLNRQNELRSRRFGEELQRTGGLSGAYGARGVSRDRERDLKAQAIVGAGQGAGQATGGILEYKNII